MTANFKKRMLSDYTGNQTTTETYDDEPHSSTSEVFPKRLRLTTRALQLDLRDITDPSLARNALQDLKLQIETLGNHGVVVSVDDLIQISEKLRDLFVLFKDNELRCAILQAHAISFPYNKVHDSVTAAYVHVIAPLHFALVLNLNLNGALQILLLLAILPVAEFVGSFDKETMGLVMALPSGTACLTPLRRFFITILRENPTVTVRTVLLRTLLQSGAVHHSNAAFNWHIIAIVERCIAEVETLDSPVLVAGCLDLIGELIPFRGAARKFILRLWGKFEKDSSNNVRSAAYRMLNKLSERGFTLDVSMYRKLCSGLEDLGSSVRSCAMDLIFRLSRKHPDYEVSNAQAATGETMRLVDDVFCKICDRVNDWEIDIRAQAATILGRMNGVTLDYVIQTVDKKLMSDLRVKVAGHERQKQLFESGEWSSGRKWADDAPKERLQQDDVTLMSIGATGAFVLALEDQYQQVRAAAVISMAQLAAKHPSFGSTCAEFLVDMFNDEIHDVRLKALKMFPLLGQGVELREDQLEMVLTVLQDASLDIREGLRMILPTFRYSSAKLIKTVYAELLNNFKQYPSDHSQICSCLANLGGRNGGLVLEDAAMYLNIHPYLQSAEPKSEDKVYVATMALVCNAAASHPEILKMFLDFHMRHYLLYRYKYPDWFPVLGTIGNTALSIRLHQKFDGHSRTNLASYFGALRRSITHARNCDTILKSLRVASVEVHEMCEKDLKMDATKNWLGLQFHFLQVYVHGLKVVEDSNWTTSTVISVEKSRSLDESLRDTVDEMRTRFCGQMMEDEIVPLHLSVLEKLLQILLTGERLGDLVEIGSSAGTEVEELCSAYQKVGMEIPNWLSVVKEDSRIPQLRLYNLLRSSIPVPEVSGSSMRRMEVDIRAPVSNMEYPVSIVAGTIHKVAFEAVVRGVDNVEGVVICIIMPDNKRLLLCPSEKDVTRENEHFIIRKEIAVTQTVWTASATLKIQLCKLLAGKCMVLSGNYQLAVDDDMKKVLFIDSPVLYHILPVPARSNL